jgi:hypothetical protein
MQKDVDVFEFGDGGVIAWFGAVEGGDLIGVFDTGFDVMKIEVLMDKGSAENITRTQRINYVDLWRFEPQ